MRRPVPGRYGARRRQDRNVEGRWQTVTKDEDGKTLRTVKEHRGGRTTVTIYNETNQVVSQHTSDYKLLKANDVQIFSYANFEYTEGPNKGQRAPGPYAYAYRIKDDTFYEVTGVVVSDQRAGNPDLDPAEGELEPDLRSGLHRCAGRPVNGP